MSLRQVPAGREPGVRAPKLPADEVSLNELYFTIQGECRFQGLPTIFVRTSHCPLRCAWCDSQYTFTQGRPWKIDAVVEEVRRHPSRHVCLTGGEPLAQPGGWSLLRRLAEEGFTVEVETSGSEDIAPLNEWPPALRNRIVVNLDVKCPGSAMSNFNRWSNLAALRPHDQLKFILRDEADYAYAADVLDRHPVPCEAFLHPVWGILDPRLIAEWVKRDGRQVRVGVQLHKYLWGDVRGV